MSPDLTDLRLVASLAVLGAVSLAVPGVPWQIEWLFGAPLLLVLPGYALVATLFPEHPDAGYEERHGPGWAARAGLAVVASALVVAGVGWTFATVGLLTATAAGVTIAVVTVVATGLAWFRRGGVPPDFRADPLAGASRDGIERAAGTRGVQSVALAVALLVLGSTLVLGGTSPSVEPYSEAYLADGAGVDVGPDDPSLVAGADNALGVVVENHEGGATDYRVVTRLQRVGPNGSVQASERLADDRIALGANESGTVEQSLAPTLTGDRLRLQVLVFAGDHEGEPTVGAADLVLRLWVSATEEGTS